MREKIAQALKDAVKQQDKRRISTLRLIQTAIKDRDVANRGAGKDPVSDDEIQDVLLRNKSHLTIDLCKLRLAVRPKILVAETLYDLVIPVKT